MGWNSGTMSLPIGWGDISDAVGIGGPPYDLATMIGNGTINKWALHKPVMLITGYDTPGDISADATWLNYMQNYVRETGSNVACPFALKVTPSINLNDVIGANNAPAVDWVYQKPPASGNFWRRSHDFRRYTSTPNVPMNPVGTFIFYLDSTNVLTIDTNDGEAGDTSIQVSMLTQLQNYRLMVVVRVGSLWYLYVMSSTIANSVSQGTISVTLPTAGGPTNAGLYDAYLVGLTTAASVTTNAWFTQTSMSSFYNMIPLPFAAKTDCHFNFRVIAVAPTNVVNIGVVFRMTSGYVLRSIEFNASKYGAITDNATFTLALYNIDVRNDNDEVIQRLNTTVRIDGPWDYDSTTRQASKTVTLDVSSYNINAGDYPNIICDTTNNRGFTVNAPYTQNVIFV